MIIKYLKEGFGNVKHNNKNSEDSITTMMNDIEKTAEELANIQKVYNALLFICTKEIRNPFFIFDDHQSYGNVAYYIMPNWLKPNPYYDRSKQDLYKLYQYRAILFLAAYIYNPDIFEVPISIMNFTENKISSNFTSYTQCTAFIHNISLCHEFYNKKFSEIFTEYGAKFKPVKFKYVEILEAHTDDINGYYFDMDLFSDEFYELGELIEEIIKLLESDQKSVSKSEKFETINNLLYSIYNLFYITNPLLNINSTEPVLHLFNNETDQPFEFSPGFMEYIQDFTNLYNDTFSNKFKIEYPTELRFDCDGIIPFYYEFISRLKTIDTWFNEYTNNLIQALKILSDNSLFFNKNGVIGMMIDSFTGTAYSIIFCFENYITMLKNIHNSCKGINMEIKHPDFLEHITKIKKSSNYFNTIKKTNQASLYKDTAAFEKYNYRSRILPDKMSYCFTEINNKINVLNENYNSFNFIPNIILDLQKFDNRPEVHVDMFVKDIFNSKTVSSRYSTCLKKIVCNDVPSTILNLLKKDATYKTLQKGLTKNQSFVYNIIMTFMIYDFENVVLFGQVKPGIIDTENTDPVLNWIDTIYKYEINYHVIDDAITTVTEFEQI